MLRTKYKDIEEKLYFIFIISNTERVTDTKYQRSLNSLYIVGTSSPPHFDFTLCSLL